LADSQLIANQTILSPSNYVRFSLARRYEFIVGTSEPHAVVFEKERPLLVAGFRPHTYRVFVDGTLVFQRRGY
jgi:hypothetical protein